MNLHIVPDSSFINAFYDNLNELGLLPNNRFVVRTNAAKLSVIRHDLPFAKLNSTKFAALVGDTLQYDQVFIHYFTPLLYRWVAQHNFKALHWMIWGGDVYNLRSLERFCFLPLTYQRYVKRNTSLMNLLYELKIAVTQTPYRRKALSKVTNILTWMEHEYQFAQHHLPVNAAHRFFFYENNQAYHKIDSLVSASTQRRETPTLIVGNSGSPANNHLDLVHYLETQGIKANLQIPVSYGDKTYIKFLRDNLRYSLGSVEFVDRYMKFEEYVSFLSEADGLVMNTIRPQGYGNILMMMYMNKPVFFNTENISLPDLTKLNIKWHPLQAIPENAGGETLNRTQVQQAFSHDRLLEVYRGLFSNSQ
ncbi:TDP-N-acetylfucosamine:lipid II N-acetylfucosaminyltransferase [Chryseolinea lacunae]|uniref:TDP-N-acetylfucosamine:lipid II N-acetylfucosaminyltransferase n=1 Tax=Chryseolinea lacunae TaxID=2801331 RepID=A0ABS1KQ33_9BACT|nr:TDP-N-acetylfucosamine:lipid II N-acetylfucosaminyltransferase [Chryseolinea lacunae]MBL0741347.1 TDP-N-acetylfucosamine:lipid II N-acetylfucosaminyltransferase [Chryseolinea lacunae]